MSNCSKRRRDVPRDKSKGMRDHQDFLKRITKTLYYGQLPSLPCLSLPVTEISCGVWSAAQRGVSLRRLRGAAAAGVARGACVSPCALVLAIVYLERLRTRNPLFLARADPAELFLVSLMVGNKFLHDDGEDDEVICSEWAASGGISIKHLHKLEKEFLQAIEWDVYVSADRFERRLAWLERCAAWREARARGFCTYTELAALAPAASASAAAQLAAVAALAALLASAALLAHAALPPASPLRLANASLAAPAAEPPLPAPPAPPLPPAPLCDSARWQERLELLQRPSFAPPALPLRPRCLRRGWDLGRLGALVVSLRDR